MSNITELPCDFDLYNEVCETTSELNNIAVDLHQEGRYVIASSIYQELTKAIDKIDFQDVVSDQSTLENTRTYVHSILNCEKKYVSRVTLSQEIRHKSNHLDIYRDFDSSYNNGLSLLTKARKLDVPCFGETIESERTMRLYLAVVFHNMALAQYELGILQNAKTSIKMAMKLLKHDTNCLSQDEIMLIPLLWNFLGCVHFKYDKFDDALTCLKESLQQLLRASRIEHDLNKALTLSGSIKNNIGRILFVKERYQDAIKCCQDALEAKAEALESDDVEIFETVYNLGLLHHKCKHYDKAVENYAYFIKGIMSKYDLCEASSTDMTTAVLNMLSILYKDIKFGDDDFDFKQKIEILRDIRHDSSLEHPIIPTILYDVGDILNRQERSHLALVFFLEYLRIMKIILGKMHPDLSKILLDIGSVYQSQGTFEIALKYYNEASELFSQINIDKNSSYRSTAIKIQFNIGIILLHVGEYEGAKQVIKLAVDEKKHILGENHPEIASLYYEVGSVQFKIGNIKDALLDTLESLRIRKLQSGKKHKLVEESLRQLGKIHEENWNYNEAINIYIEILQIKEYRFGRHHPCLIFPLIDMGRIYHKKGEICEAMTMFQRALSITTACRRDENKNVAEILNEIASMNAEMGRTEQAMQAYMKRARLMRSLGLSIDVVEDQKLFLRYATVYQSLAEPTAAAA